jgi:hypothetical protein
MLAERVDPLGRAEDPHAVAGPQLEGAFSIATRTGSKYHAMQDAGPGVPRSIPGDAERHGADRLSHERIDMTQIHASVRPRRSSARWHSTRTRLRAC